MKLKNKNSGEIMYLLFNSYPVSGDIVLEYIDENAESGYSEYRRYKTLAELNTDWEDYEPKDPIIHDKKIRKAVRAWSEMNDIRFIHMCSRTRKENARIVGQNAVGRTFTMEISNEYETRICFKDYKECYTVDELCGVEE